MIRPMLPSIRRCMLMLAALFGGSSLILLSGSDAPTRALSTGPVRLKPPILNLGSVYAGDAIEFEFEVINTSNQAIEIGDVIAGCACTEAKVVESELAAFGRTKLSGRVNVPSEKELSVQITVAGDAGNQFVAVGYVEGNVQSRIAVTPPSIALSPDLAASTNGQSLVLIKNRTREPLRIGTLRAQRQGREHDVTATFPGALQVPAHELVPAGSVSLTITVPSTTTAPSSWELQIPIESKTGTELATVAVNIKPKSGLEVAPSALNFGLSRRADVLAVRQIVLIVRGSLLQDSRLDQVELPAFLKAQQSRASDANSLSVVMSVINKFASSSLSGTITLRFTHIPTSTQFTADIPLSGFLVDFGDDGTRPLDRISPTITKGEIRCD